MPNVFLTSFNNGEVSPQIDARSDVAKYASSCRTLENMLPLVYGGVTRRPGTQEIAIAKLSPGGIRLIPFIYSADIAYMCEFGNGYIRFFYNKAPLLDELGVQVEIASPYAVADLPSLQYRQLGDTMRLVHPSYHPQYLTRPSPTSFSIDEIVFARGPFMTRNDLVDPDADSSTLTTLQSSVMAKNATGTLVASDPVFFAGHVGSLWALTHHINTTQVTLSETSPSTGTSYSLTIKGTFTFTTHGTWTGTVLLERSDDLGDTWNTYRQFTSKDDANVSLAGVENEDDIQYRINVSALSSGTIDCDLSMDSSERTGIVRITGITSTTHASIVVLSRLAHTTATKKWAEGSWSNYRGWPTAFTFYQSRACYGGTQHQPRYVWLSASDDYENYEEGVLDDDSFSVPIETTNDIRWMEDLDSLAVGTSGDEWAISSNRLDQALTPTNVSSKRHQTYGAKALQAIRASKSALFWDRVGRKYREFTYVFSDDKFDAPDLAVLAEHITYPSVVAHAYQKNPDSIIWAVREDGTLISFTYERDQDVTAWARHLTGKTLEETTTVIETSNPIIDYRMTYINDSQYIWGLPIDWVGQTTLRVDAGDSRNVGAGFVGIPCTKHPFKVGMTVWFTGTSNYDSAYVLQAATTANELVIQTSFVAETFDGTETVIQRIGPLNLGVGRMAQDATGNIYYAQNVTGLQAVGRITDQLTSDLTFIHPTTAFTNGKGTYGLKITKDSKFLYVHTDSGMLWKFDLETGLEVWSVQTYTGARLTVFDIDVDDDGNVYTTVSGADVGGQKNISKFNAADGSRTDYTNSSLALSIAVSKKDNIVVCGGYQTGTTPSPTLINLSMRTLDDSNGATKLVGTITSSGGFDTTSTVGSECILIHNGFVYVVCDHVLYKLTTQLTTVKTVSTMPLAIGLFTDLWGHIVVVSRDQGGTVDTGIFQLYDDNLNHVGTIDGAFKSILTTWAASVGGDYIQGNAVFWPGIFSYETTVTETHTATGSVESVAVLPGATEDEVWLSVLRPIGSDLVRFIECMAPRQMDAIEDAFFVDCGVFYDGDATTEITGLDHLEGQQVAILADGAVYPMQEVSGGAITLPVAVTKASVGLPWRYTLQPMRIDFDTKQGNSHGSIKTIPEVVISFHRTGGAQFGPDVDHIKTIPFRTTEAYGSPPALFTGDTENLTMEGGFNTQDPFVITGEDPLPCTVRGIVARVQVTGR